MSKKSVFAKAKPFVEAFREVSQDGFFHSIEVSGTWFGNLSIGNLCIKATGYIPDTLAFMQDSVDVFFDPAEILRRIEKGHTAMRLGPENMVVEVNISPWVRYNKEETKVISTIGRQFNLALRIFQNTGKS